jgi:stage VI sporulation protein D
VTNMDWRQGVELYVDQQVFIDTVHGNERVVDVSAHTELSTFEQRGDSLYLEGNILFTSYLESMPLDAIDGGANETHVEHVQHRMPFDLLVSVNAQVAGLLSVQVTVPDSSLDVLGPGWVHIRGNIHVDGLSAEGGYTAHCGAQEAIVSPSPSFLSQLVPELEPSSQEEAIVKVIDDNYEESAESVENKKFRPLLFEDLLQPYSVNSTSLQEFAGEETVDSGTKPTDWFATDPMAYARTQSVDPDFEESDPKDTPAVIDLDLPESSQGASDWKEQLFEADRAFNGNDAPHFHFEHVQLNEDDEQLPLLDTEKILQSLTETELHEVPAEDVLSRSEWSDALQTQDEIFTITSHVPFEGIPSLDAHFNVLAAEQHVERQVMDQKEYPTVQSSFIQNEPIAETDVSPKEMQMSYTSVPEAPVDMTAAQWFWKTLNIPSASEPSYTLRFRIVQERDSLEEIASRYNVSVSEILRANPAAGNVAAGTLLYIPS